MSNNEYTRRLRRALESVKNGSSFCAAGKKEGVCEKAVKRYFNEMIENDIPVNAFIPISCGRPEYLGEQMRRVLSIFLHTMDGMGFPISPETATKKIAMLRGIQLGIESAEAPSPPTVRKLLRECGVRLRSVRNGLAVRGTKTSAKYMFDYFGKLRNVVSQFHSDEMGICIAGMKISVLTTRSVVRRDLMVSGHLTALLTTCANGDLAPTALIFPGSSASAIPADLLLRPDVWTAFSENAYMDTILFQGIMINLGCRQNIFADRRWPFFPNESRCSSHTCRK